MGTKDTFEVNVNIACMAVYSSCLDVPKSLEGDAQGILDYIRDNLDKCPVHDIEFVSDIDPCEAVTIEDLKL